MKSICVLVLIAAAACTAGKGEFSGRSAPSAPPRENPTLVTRPFGALMFCYATASVGRGYTSGICAHNSAPRECADKWSLESLTVHDPLPPGIELKKPFLIEGTPTQAGTWRGRATAVGVACPGQNYGNLDFWWALTVSP